MQCNECNSQKFKKENNKIIYISCKKKYIFYNLKSRFK